VTLDLPKSRYREKISRDEWMAESIAKIFKQNSNAKMLVIVGNNHVLKKLEWQDHVPNSHKSIREYVLEFNPDLRMLSGEKGVRRKRRKRGQIFGFDELKICS
jgi:hypothetical protein